MLRFRTLAAALAVSLTASFAAAPAVSAAPDTKEEEIALNAALSQRLIEGLSASGACPSDEAVLAIIHTETAQAEMQTIASALEVVLASAEWCDSARATLTAALDAAHTVLAARSEEAVSASATAQTASPATLGGYGSNWGSGGSGYTY